MLRNAPSRLPRRARRLRAWGGLLLALVLASAPVATAPVATAQELDCDVSVDVRQISGTEVDFLQDLERQIREYLNQRNWTDDRFEPIERIDCTMQLVFVQAISLTRFSVRLAVAAQRPIYGTSQQTTVFRVTDAEWTFDYARGTPLRRLPDGVDPITSVLDFYAFLILGYDYDTFSELGGTRFFDQARRIAERAQGQLGGQGWSTLSGSRSRYQLVQQILDPRFQPLRQAYFTYHFNGLDRFVAETRQARQNVLAALGSLDRLYREVSRAYAIDVFMGTKSGELVAMFQDAPSSDTAYDVLTRLDPSNATQYNRLIE
jgi:hypothetical protein